MASIFVENLQNQVTRISSLNLIQKMAESNVLALLESRSLQLRTKDEKFAVFKASVDNKFTCTHCRIVPRKPQKKNYPTVQILQDGSRVEYVPTWIHLYKESDPKSKIRKIACDKCYSMEHSIRYERSSEEAKRFRETLKKDKFLQDLLPTLPTSCKARKHGCQFVEFLDKMKEHEEECEFREVPCPVAFCYSIQLSKLTEHLKEGQIFFEDMNIDEHNFDLNTTSPNVKIEGSKFKFKFERHVENIGTTHFEHFRFDGKTFLCQMMHNTDEQFVGFWIQLVGSRAEAKNYRCWIQVGNPDYEVYTYKGKIKCINDDMWKTFEERSGMNVGICDESELWWTEEGDDENWVYVDVEVEMKKVGPQEEPSNNNEKKG